MAPTQSPYTVVRDLTYPAEKAVTHTAFDLTPRRELDVIIREAEDRAVKSVQPSDLWGLDHCLTQHRKRIDRQFNPRYHVLIRDERLFEQDLLSLPEDRLILIRQQVTL